jgi:thiol-disulfide isomerase/thioredoxin
MKKVWLMLGALACACSVGASELNKIELKVNPEWIQEFEKPLPEFLAYSPDGRCLMHSSGFGDQEYFLSQVEQVMEGKTLIVPTPPITDEIKAQIRKTIEQSEQIPDEFKGEAYLNSVAKLENPPAQCDKTLDALVALYVNQDNSDFKLDKILRKQTIFIEYHAEWCVPCKQQERAMDYYANQVRSDFTLLKVERDIKKIIN